MLARHLLILEREKMWSNDSTWYDDETSFKPSSHSQTNKILLHAPSVTMRLKSVHGFCHRYSIVPGREFRRSVMVNYF